MARTAPCAGAAPIFRMAPARKINEIKLQSRVVLRRNSAVWGKARSYSVPAPLGALCTLQVDGIGDVSPPLRTVLKDMGSLCCLTYTWAIQPLVQSSPMLC